MTSAIKFLLVDDVSDNLAVLEALLRRDGLELLIATSGTEALELLRVHEVALAVLDVQMPGMDGFELAERMRDASRTKHVPIIFLTAGAHDPQRIFRGYETGAIDFLFKPVDARVLLNKANVFFELAHQRQELVAALRLNEMFVGALGHDLRAPLGALVSGVSIIDREDQPPADRRVLARMRSAGDRMTAMIDQLLDLTRARLAGGLEFAGSCARMNLEELVARTVEELRGMYPAREIAITATSDTHTYGDAERMLQLLSNIIGNALQHGLSTKPVKIVLDGERDAVRILVHSHGVIPAELIGSIFDPFRGRAKTSKSRGLGLGLYIARQIAVAHGGTLAVSSSAGAGTVFTTVLPRRGARRSEDAAQASILIVDDDLPLPALEHAR